MRFASARLIERLGAFAVGAFAIGALALVGCDPGHPTMPSTEPRQSTPITPADSLRQELRVGLTGIVILRPPPVRPALVRLGQALAFDAMLSGPKNISCITCHQPAFATTDGRSLAFGQGARGVGPARTGASGQSFTPRNVPALFNLRFRNTLFHDGRVQLQLDGTLRTPAGAKLTPEMARVFEFGALSAVPMFPVLDRLEMRGTSGNELASLADDDMAGVWSALMKRLGAIPEYRTLFEAAYPGTPFNAMTFAHASNAIAGFFVESFTMIDSPFQKFVAGDDAALTPVEIAGGREFIRHACTSCHFGPDFSDQSFHNTGLPQIGPGLAQSAVPSDDIGRADVTAFPGDQHRFRTPTLLNVELTAPYGHAGQFATLLDHVEHYDRAAIRFAEYDVSQLEPVLRSMRYSFDVSFLLGLDKSVEGLQFDAASAERIAGFLRALTDPAARHLDHVIPARVPSGLPIDRP